MNSRRIDWNDAGRAAIICGCVGFAGWTASHYLGAAWRLLGDDALRRVVAGQTCYVTCASPERCPGGADSLCEDHGCPGPGNCPSSLEIGTNYTTTTYCLNCDDAYVGRNACKTVTKNIYCEYSQNCQGTCVRDNAGAFWCPYGGQVGIGANNWDNQPTGTACPTGLRNQKRYAYEETLIADLEANGVSYDPFVTTAVNAAALR